MGPEGAITIGTKAHPADLELQNEIGRSTLMHTYATGLHPTSVELTVHPKVFRRRSSKPSRYSRRAQIQAEFYTRRRTVLF